MAFKMAPKSPVLMATGKFGSPAKNMNKGYGPAKTSSPAKQTKEGGSISDTRGSNSSELTKKGATKTITALQQAQQEADAAQMNNKVAQIRRNTAGTKKETARLGKRTARDNSGAQRKNKNAINTQKRVDEREKSGKTRVGKVVAKIKKAVSPAKQRTGGHRIKKKTLVKKLPELGNKNAEMGADGKMTIISANMAKNQKPMKLKKDKFKDKKMKMEKVKLKNNPSR